MVGSSRRESREAETQFMDHPSLPVGIGSGAVGGGGAGPASLTSMAQPGSGHSSLEYSLVNGVGSERQRDLAVCAVVLDEWLKELSAITQEQSLVMVAAATSEQQPNRPVVS
ncbi:hypothetical protein pipiens_000796, partial [Culex pipiens pipiens]